MCSAATHEGLNTGNRSPESPGGCGHGAQAGRGRQAIVTTRLSYWRRTLPWADKTCPPSEDRTTRSHGKLDSASPSETQQNEDTRKSTVGPKFLAWMEGLRDAGSSRDSGVLRASSQGRGSPAVAVTRPRVSVGEDRGCREVSGRVSPGGKVRRGAPGDSTWGLSTVLRPGRARRPPAAPRAGRRDPAEEG